MEENDKFIVLINRVKEEEILYNNLVNTGSPLDEAWKRISSDLEMPVAECKTIWAKLKDQYVKALTNSQIVKMEDYQENVNYDFKYRKEMEFLSNYIGHSSSAIEETSVGVNIKREVADPSSSADLKEPMDCNENSSEILDFEAQSYFSIERNNENEYLELSDEVDGEIIIELGDEYLAIPAKIINSDNEDESFKDDVIVNITPKSKLSNIHSSDTYIPVELEIEGNYEPKVKIPYNQIFDLLNLNEELNLHIDSESNVKSIKDDKIVLIPKRKYQDMEDEDPSSEEFFYKTLALTATNIENIKDRLELRQKVSNCVMEAVRKYYLKNEQNFNR